METKTKTKIYNYLINAFYENGFYNSDVTDILSKKNISYYLFAKYFTTKNEVLSILYTNMYLDLINEIDEINNLFLPSLEKLEIFFDFLYEYVDNNIIKFSIIIETSPRVDTILNDYELKNIKLLDDSLYSKEYELINQCKMEGSIKKINTSLVIDLIIFIIKQNLDRLSINKISSPELKNFFWNVLI